jgi:drug/metabolite transporter (DMT)-like permease
MRRPKRIGKSMFESFARQSRLMVKLHGRLSSISGQSSIVHRVARRFVLYNVAPHQFMIFYRMIRSFLPALFALFWSTGFIVARAAAPHADLQLFLLCRFAVVTVLLGVAAVAAGVHWPSPRELVQHVLAGAVMMGLYLTLSFWAIAHGLPAGIMALMGALQPLFTAALMLSRGRSRPSMSMLLGLSLGFAGVVLVLWPRLANSGFAPANSANVAAGILSIVALTIGTLAQRRLASDDLRVAGCLQNLGAAMVAVVAMGIVGTTRWDSTLLLWGTLLWAVLISSIAAQGLLMWMMRHGEATRVTALMLLVPPLAAILAYALFHETLTPLQFAGFALALAGVLLTRRMVN